MSYAPDTPLVEAAWLMDHLGAPDVRVLDATWFMPGDPQGRTGRAAYDTAHVPGAAFLDIEAIADRDSPLPHMLPSSVQFASQVRKLGIGDGHRLVVYDQNRLCASARAWWMFRAMGHLDVRVLDGGMAAWLAAGGETEDIPPLPMERHFTPRVRADLVRDRGQVAALCASGGGMLIDARPAGRFEGSLPEPRPDLPSGHIPGSRNLPAGHVIAQTGRLKPADELEALFGPLEGPVITTCGSGVSAAILLLALAAIGHDTAALYDGSWSDWASMPGADIATGPAA